MRSHRPHRYLASSSLALRQLILHDLLLFELPAARSAPGPCSLNAAVLMTAPADSDATELALERLPLALMILLAALADCKLKKKKRSLLIVLEPVLLC